MKKFFFVQGRSTVAMVSARANSGRCSRAADGGNGARRTLFVPSRPAGIDCLYPQDIS